MIKLEKVTKFYKSEDTVGLGLKNISLTFENNEFVSIVGQSGSGKSTLLNIISGLDSFDEGSLYFEGNDIAYYSKEELDQYRNDNFGFVFQKYNIVESYTVYENLYQSLYYSNYDGDYDSRIKELLKKVGLSDFINKKAKTLSGGQKQRVVIARALAKESKVLIADEPTGNLDSKSAKQVMEILHELSKEKLVLVVTHNKEEVKDYHTREITISNGEVTSDRRIRTNKKTKPVETNNTKKFSIVKTTRFAVNNIRTHVSGALILLVGVLLMNILFLGTQKLPEGIIDEIVMENLGSMYGLTDNSNRVIVYNSDDSKIDDDTYQILEDIKGGILFENDYIFSETYVIYEYDENKDAEGQIASGNIIKPASTISNGYTSTGKKITGKYKDLARNEVVISYQGNDVIKSACDTKDYLNIALGISREYGSINRSAAVKPEKFKVVGCVEGIDEIYLSNDYLEEIAENQLPTTKSNRIDLDLVLPLVGGGYASDFIGDIKSNFIFEVDNTLNDGEVSLNSAAAAAICYEGKRTASTVDCQAFDSPGFRIGLGVYDGNTFDKKLIYNTVKSVPEFDLSEAPNMMIYRLDKSVIYVNQALYDLVTTNYQSTILANTDAEVGSIYKQLAKNDITYLETSIAEQSLSSILKVVQVIVYIVYFLFMSILGFAFAAVLMALLRPRRDELIITRSIGAKKFDLILVQLLELIMLILTSLVLIVIVSKIGPLSDIFNFVRITFMDLVQVFITATLVSFIGIYIYFGRLHKKSINSLLSSND